MSCTNCTQADPLRKCTGTLIFYVALGDAIEGIGAEFHDVITGRRVFVEASTILSNGAAHIPLSGVSLFLSPSFKFELRAYDPASDTYKHIQAEGDVTDETLGVECVTFEVIEVTAPDGTPVAPSEHIITL